LAFFTNLHVLALCGFAAVCAVLGEQFLEKVINERLTK
jgi:energy-converting hydrogenase Eha subunit E